jgi:lauroyl/myristoyl acyltransferase
VILRALGVVLAKLAYFVFRLRRVHVERAFALGGVSLAPLAFYRSLGVSAVELLACALRPNAVKAMLTPAAVEVLARAKRTPHVFAVAHTGNWELAAFAAAQRAPLSCLAKPLSVGWLDRALNTTRKRHGLHLVRNLKEVFAALERGRSVAILIDQVPQSFAHGERAQFMGQCAYVDRTAALVAARANVPLVFASSRREQGRTVLDVSSAFVPSGAMDPTWIRATTLALNGLLEDFVTRHPSEWLWLHRRWKTPLDLRA